MLCLLLLLINTYYVYLCQVVVWLLVVDHINVHSIRARSTPTTPHVRERKYKRKIFFKKEKGQTKETFALQKLKYQRKEHVILVCSRKVFA